MSSINEFPQAKHLGNQHSGQRTERYSTSEAYLLLIFCIPRPTHTQVYSMVCLLTTQIVFSGVCTLQKWTHAVCIFVTGSFCSTLFLRFILAVAYSETLFIPILYNIPLSEYTIIYLWILFLKSIYIISSFGLLQRVLL